MHTSVPKLEADNNVNKVSKSRPQDLEEKILKLINFQLLKIKL